LAQVGLASTYWLIVPLALYALRPTEADVGYPELAAAYALAAVARVVGRLPAGLGGGGAGVFAVVPGRGGAGPVPGMLVWWRAVFLLVPLAVAAVALALLEYRARAMPGPAAPRQGRASAARRAPARR